MGESSKVLSVTYGTFACHLEGFDDSVETMKTVVSYFHDLAGHNRFMDLDPQAPDLEELAELTTETDAAPVEAAVTAAGLSLRVARPAADEEPEERPSLRIKRPKVDVPDELPVDDDIDSTPAVEAEADDLSSLKDVFADPEEEDVSDLDDDVAEDASEPEELSSSEDDAVDEFVAEDEPEIAKVEDYVGQEPEEPVQDELVSEDVEDTIVAEVTEDEPENEIVEEKPVTEVVDEEPEDELEDEPIAEAVEEEDVTEVDQEEPVAEATEEEPLVEAVEEEPEDDAPFYDPQEAAQETVDPRDDSVSAKLDRIRAVVGRVPNANRGTPKPVEDPSNSVTDRLSAMTGHNPEAEVEEEEQTEDIVDGFEFKAPETRPLVVTRPLVLSDDDSVDDNDNAEQIEAAEEEDEETAHRRRNLSKRSHLPDHDDDAMSRIMNQADERLSEPEGRRQRDAFAQLKAAVVATEAARQLGDDDKDADPKDAFREDLDEVVKDEAGENDVEGPTDPTPLKLVPDQRIEETTEAQTESTPSDGLRQIAAAIKTSNTEDTGGFAEYVADQGISELPDLLEAAGAYIAFVEGDDDFSRPQIMKMVQATADDFSREDGLRSFGRLLRQNRIMKLNNGRFKVAEDTQFRPVGKAAQG